MAIKVECPHCFADYSVKDELAGKKLRCKSCGEAIAVPKKTVKSKANTDEEEDEDDFLEETPRARRSISKKRSSSKSSRSGSSGDGSWLTSPQGHKLLLWYAIGTPLVSMLITFFFPEWARIHFAVFGLPMLLLQSSLVIWLTVIAFQESVLSGVFFIWGVIYPFYFVVTRWDRVKRVFFVQLFPLLWFVVTVVTLCVVTLTVGNPLRKRVPGAMDVVEQHQLDRQRIIEEHRKREEARAANNSESQGVVPAFPASSDAAPQQAVAPAQNASPNSPSPNNNPQPNPIPPGSPFNRGGPTSSPPGFPAGRPGFPSNAGPPQGPAGQSAVDGNKIKTEISFQVQSYSGTGEIEESARKLLKELPGLEKATVKYDAATKALTVTSPEYMSNANQAADTLRKSGFTITSSRFSSASGGRSPGR